MPVFPDPQVEASAVNVKRGLVETLRAWPGLQGVLVTWGVTVAAKPAEWVSVGQVRRVEKAAALGGHRREETLTVTVTISVRGTNIDDVEPLTTRAYAIQGEVARAVRPGTGDATLGGAVRWIEYQGDDLDERDVEGETIEARITCRLVTHNRI